MTAPRLQTNNQTRAGQSTHFAWPFADTNAVSDLSLGGKAGCGQSGLPGDIANIHRGLLTLRKRSALTNTSTLDAAIAPAASPGDSMIKAPQPKTFRRKFFPFLPLALCIRDDWPY